MDLKDLKTTIASETAGHTIRLLAIQRVLIKSGLVDPIDMMEEIDNMTAGFSKALLSIDAAQKVGTTVARTEELVNRSILILLLTGEHSVESLTFKQYEELNDLLDAYQKRKDEKASKA